MFKKHIKYILHDELDDIYIIFCTILHVFTSFHIILQACYQGLCTCYSVYAVYVYRAALVLGLRMST